jgi:peptide/nickel transport system permease protein
MIVLSAIPYYLLAIVLIFVLAVALALLPPASPLDSVLIVRVDVATAIDVVRHAILPALSIVLSSMGFWALTMRGLMVSVLAEDYIVFAEAKGLSRRRILSWYGIRNALLPQTTALALTMGSLVSGSVLVETIFNYPGLGLLLIQAVQGRDLESIRAITSVLIISLALALFVIELLYPVLDPRVRHRR